MDVAVFIDNSNVFKSIRKVRAVDHQWESFYNPHKLALNLTGNRNLVYVGFYCVHPPVSLLSEDAEHKKKHILTEQYYSSVEKLPLTQVKYGQLHGKPGSYVEKNLDTQICADIITMAAMGEFDVAILVSNDGDFVSAVENIKKFGRKVEVVFFKDGFSMDLRKSCDITRVARRSHFERLIF